MYTKKITYTDFDGQQRTEEFHFTLTQAECVELELLGKEGLDSYIRRIISSEDQVTILDIIKKVIMLAYGEKSPDGRKFYKNQQMRDEFAASEAYSALFMELLTNEDKAAEFMHGIAPKAEAQISDKPAINATASVVQ